MIKERYENSILERKEAYDIWWNNYSNALKKTHNEEQSLGVSSELWEHYQEASRIYEVCKKDYISLSKGLTKDN